MALDGYTFDPNGTTGYPLAANHYREMDASGAAGWSETDGDATRNLITNWDGNLDFASSLLGYAEYSGVGSGVTRVLPDFHPEMTWLYALAARRSAVTPSRVTDGVSNWTMAKFETSYRPVDYYVLDNDAFAPNELYRFVARKTIPKGDYLQLSVNAFSWHYAGGNLGSVPGIIVPSKTLEYTWHMVPSKPVAGFNINQPLRCPIENTILRLLGTTNLGVFDSIYPQGTVLFVGAEATLIPPRFNPLYHWTIRFFFEQKDHGLDESGMATIGVNYIFNPVSNKWDFPEIAAGLPGAGNGLYAYTDLNQLFVLTAGS